MFFVTHTHLYPGCRLRMLEDEDSKACAGLAEFSDGTIVGVTVETIDRESMCVAVNEYRTGKGTFISGRSWVVRRDLHDWVVIRRMITASIEQNRGE